MTIFIAISSPRSINLHELIGCLCIVSGIYMQAPALHDPGFSKQEPSVNAITAFSSHPSIIFQLFL